MTTSHICVVLPYPPTYSETFLTTHVERLPAVVRYLRHFPVDTSGSYISMASQDRTGKLKQRLKAVLHNQVLNPTKTVCLRNFLRTNKIRVVLAEYGSTGVGTMEVCKELQIPLIVHFHGADAYLNENLNRHQEKYKPMFAFSSAIIAVSNHMAQQLIRLGAPSEKVFYNPYGVQITKFKQASCIPAELQVLAVGRFVEKKAPHLTILAFKKVLERLPEAKLTMVGVGPLQEACRQLIKSLRLEHAVDLRGVINHNEVASIMQKSRVFVQHSLVPKSGDSEGTPVSILEASASALPVVSTKHGGIVDAVIHGKTGLLVDEGDVDGMAEYLYRLLANPGLAADMGRRGREHINEKFNVDTNISRLRDILEQYSLKN